MDGPGGFVGVGVICGQQLEATGFCVADVDGGDDVAAAHVAEGGAVDAERVYFHGAVGSAEVIPTEFGGEQVATATPVVEVLTEIGTQGELGGDDAAKAFVVSEGVVGAVAVEAVEAVVEGDGGIEAEAGDTVGIGGLVDEVVEAGKLRSREELAVGGQMLAAGGEVVALDEEPRELAEADDE